MQSFVPLLILVAVAVLIGARRIGPYRIPAWLAATGGAFVAVLSGAIGPGEAVGAIDWEVLVTLAALFVVGAGLSGSRLADLLLDRLDDLPLSPAVLAALVGGIAVLSALVTNDAVAVIGTPFLIRFASRRGLSPLPFLLLLMAAVTTGAVPSPLGSPQNLLIASSPAIEAPFATFLLYLGPPTLAALAVIFVLLRRCYPDALTPVSVQGRSFVPEPRTGDDPSPGDLPVLLSLLVLVSLVATELVSSLVASPLRLPPYAIALSAAAPLILLGPDRRRLLAGIDWRTLLLFAGLFVMTAAVRNSDLVEAALGPAIGAPGFLIAVSILGSQVVSNVPFVALALPFVEPYGTAVLMALAAGSTIAGHLTPIGAASNLIVIESAERRGIGVPARAFVRFGLPLVLLQALLYWAWLVLLGGRVG
jgi:Na+/H+ antiporter NhaD/arsenite permease-like protein